VVVLYFGSKIVTSPNWIQIDDFVEYWAAGSLNIHDGNPYDPDQLLPLQLNVGRYFGVPVMMWNPPWMLALAMPISLFPYQIGRVLWVVIFVITTLVSINLIWLMYGGLPKWRPIGWLIGFSFVPILEAIRTGQTGPLLLLGVVGFLYFYWKEKLIVAGMFLALLMVKPHILYLLLYAVVLWSLYKLQIRVILGTGIALLATLLVSWVINPSVIDQYLYALTNYPPNDWATPTIGGITRLVLGTTHFWIQFVPPLVGSMWFTIYFLQRRKKWNWTYQTPLIVLVSILTAAYGWTSDQSASLIPILQVFILLIPIRFNNNKHLIIICFYLVIEILLFIPLGNQIWNFWVAPSLLIWYLISIRLIRSEQENSSSQIEVVQLMR
jgi:hypothetical protein